MSLSAPVYWYDDLDSTSEEAKRRAVSGETGPLWIAARAQNAGRGRLGRTWVSPHGNLFATFLDREPGGLAQAARLPFAAALAVVDTVLAFVPGAEPRLKWPNDVRVNGAKLSGILVESGQTRGDIWVALGIGINVQHAPEAEGQATVSLAQLGAPVAVTAADVLNELSERAAQRRAVARADFAQTLRDWLAYADGLGQEIEAGPAEARVTGVFEGLAEDGGLILRLRNGQTQVIRAGDVDLVRRVV